MIEIPEDDPTRTYSEAEKQALSIKLEELLQRVNVGAVTEPLTVGLMCSFHRVLFGGVRGHAGKHRTSDFGAEHLTFGPIRSLHRRDVLRALELLAQRTRRRLEVDFPEGSAFDSESLQARIQLVAEFHAEFIRIHPFEDGNGRVGRALMSYLLVRLGLLPIPIEANKQEYYAALNESHSGKGLHALVDLLLRLYPVDT